MHYYQFNIGDYARDTRHLSNLEDLAYRRLLELYYKDEKPLCSDVAKIARHINMRDNIEEINAVLEDFFVLIDDCYVNKRADLEILAYHAKADASRANGKKGGRPKKPNPNPEETQQVNLANPEETQGKGNQEPLTNKHKPYYLPEYVQLVEDYIKYVSETFGNKAPKATSSLKDKSLETIDKLVRLDKFTFKEVSEALRYSTQDDFWKDQILSLASLRKKSGNGLTKFQNLISSKEKVVTRKPKLSAKEEKVSSAASRIMAKINQSSGGHLIE